jgi:hypothetical protein
MKIRAESDVRKAGARASCPPGPDGTCRSGSRTRTLRVQSDAIAIRRTEGTTPPSWMPRYRQRVREDSPYTRSAATPLRTHRMCRLLRDRDAIDAALAAASALTHQQKPCDPQATGCDSDPPGRKQSHPRAMVVPRPVRSRSHAPETRFAFGTYLAGGIDRQPRNARTPAECSPPPEAGSRQPKPDAVAPDDFRAHRMAITAHAHALGEAGALASLRLRPGPRPSHASAAAKPTRSFPHSSASGTL